MICNVFIQWKNRPLTVAILAAGYTLGILVCSIGSSLIIDAVGYTQETSSGSNPHQEYMQIGSYQGLPDYHQLLDIAADVRSEGQIQIRFQHAWSTAWTSPLPSLV